MVTQRKPKPSKYLTIPTRPVQVDRDRSVAGLLEKIVALKNLEVAGLMCIPPYLEDLTKVRPYFARLRMLRDDLAGKSGLTLPVLSMGMSHDFEVAIEEGATLVRVGTAIFGPR